MIQNKLLKVELKLAVLYEFHNPKKQRLGHEYTLNNANELKSDDQKCEYKYYMYIRISDEIFFFKY